MLLLSLCKGLEKFSLFKIEIFFLLHYLVEQHSSLIIEQFKALNWFEYFSSYCEKLTIWQYST